MTGSVPAAKRQQMVDEVSQARITEILPRKSEFFAEVVRVSETADSAPEAFDISDAEIVVADVERLLSGR